MKNIIAKIFSGENDEEVHSDFIKFSRGVFQDRYLIEGKKQKDKWSIKTSAEFANFFVRRCLEKSRGEVEVKGAIILTKDIRSEFKFPIESVKSYMGIKQFLIETTTSADKILEIMNKYPRAFYALSFSTKDCELKIKAKPPKSGKPGKKGEDEVKADFCSLKTPDVELIRDLFFDFPNFNEIKIKHTIEIKEIEIPKNFKTPEEMREKSVRKGVVKRFVDAEGKKEMKEKNFAV